MFYNVAKQHLEALMKEWEKKAHRVINALCRQSFLKQNTTKSGALRKIHAPYSVPVEAVELIDCLKTGNELKAKSMFCFNYEISRLSF